jgi:hypothetical protein
MHLTDFIVCDDIRHEINRKVTLVGIYGDSINLISTPGTKVTWPLAMKLGLYIRLQIDSTDEIKPNTLFELTCLHEGMEFMRFDGSMILKESIKSLFAIPLSAVIPFPGPGKITFALKLKTADGKAYEEGLLSSRMITINESQVTPEKN